MSTYAATDRCTDIILNFIYRYESKGNYNAYWQHGDNVSSPSLVNMTVAQVLAFQDQLVAAGSKSSACGAPQFIRTTLKGLTPVLTARFSPEYQDALAVKLLVVRGYQEWWLGELDNEPFAWDLSREWASMPNPRNGGLSFYPGQKTRYTVDQVYAMLDQARAAIGTPAPSPAPPPAPLPGPAIPDAMRLELLSIADRIKELVS